VTLTLANFCNKNICIHVCNHGFITELNGFNLSAGKIYAGLIIAENWKAYKASQSKGLKFIFNLI
jgi:hypothetical protein